MEVKEKKLATVIVTRKDGIAIVTLNRPEKLNAWSPELVEDLIEALEEVAVDDAVRAVIITGAGKSFCAGGDVEKDIATLSKMGPSQFTAYLTRGMLVYTTIIDMEKPVIAAINGYAVGAGLDLSIACDIRIAAEDAKLGEFFVRMGLIPEAAVYLLPRLIGLGKAKLLSFTGELVSAKEAEQMGLVDKVVPADKLMSSAEELAQRLAEGPAAIGIIKKAINGSLGMNINSSLDYITRLSYQSVHTEDHKEAFTAWLEKRKPVFKGK